MAQKYEKQNSKVFNLVGGQPGQHYGDVTFVGSTTTTVAGKIYMLSNVEGALGWAIADQDGTTATGLLAIAIGTSSSVNGMLLRGVAVTSVTNLVVGSPVYLGDNGEPTTTAPSGTGDRIRIIGYAFSSKEIYFSPDNSYIKLS